jgi:hypothetical protein
MHALAIFSHESIGKLPFRNHRFSLSAKKWGEMIGKARENAQHASLTVPQSPGQTEASVARSKIRRFLPLPSPVYSIDTPDGFGHPGKGPRWGENP